MVRFGMRFILNLSDESEPVNGYIILLKGQDL